MLPKVAGTSLHATSELNEPILVSPIANAPLLLFKTGAGVRAIEDVCPHRFASSTRGRRFGAEIARGLKAGRAAVAPSVSLLGVKTVSV